SWNGSKTNLLTLSLACSFASGAQGSIVTGTGHPQFDLSVEVVGANESAHLSNMAVLEHVGGTSHVKNSLHVYRASATDSGGSRAGYAPELAAFVDAIRRRGRFQTDFGALIPAYQIIEDVLTTVEAAADAPSWHAA
ncbi:MAG TPA: hypothetical protein VK665_11070, partial [Candidatus Elarobacter sp.]|nr:hypothetical protein [Candidatus Elarobacter sp.]